MSGTSVDGIDVALIKQSTSKTQFIAGSETPYPAPVREQILTLCKSQNTDLTALGELTQKISHAYADAVNKLLLKEGIKAAEIIAIGVHGQTVFHQPTGDWPFSMQLVNPAYVAAHTGITTVHDFRSMDIALGGQGAPLVPLFHKTLLPSDDNQAGLVFLNIGGIANISIVNPAPLLGFDTGSGNVLLDAWIAKVKGLTYDNNGAFAACGSVNQVLLKRLLSEDYLQQLPPKSSGRELFNLDWLNQHLSQFNQSISDADVMATLVDLTVLPIVEAIASLPAGKLLVCGGGAKNMSMMQRLSQLLPSWEVSTTDAYGINADYMEAIAFAWLAYRCIAGLPGNAPNVTGASRTAICGAVTRLAE